MYLRELGALLRSGGRIPESYELTYVDRVATILFPLLLIDHLLGLWTPPGGGERLPPGFFAWALAQYLVVCSQSFWVSNTRYLALILPAYLMLERALDNRPVFFAWMLASGGTAAWAIRNYANMHWVF